MPYSQAFRENWPSLICFCFQLTPPWPLQEKHPISSVFPLAVLTDVCCALAVLTHCITFNMSLAACSFQGHQFSNPSSAGVDETWAECCVMVLGLALVCRCALQSCFFFPLSLCPVLMQLRHVWGFMPACRWLKNREGRGSVFSVHTLWVSLLMHFKLSVNSSVCV